MFKVVAATLVAAAQALAEERQGPSRRIVVSIPDRKLVVVEAGRVVKTYTVAVGAPASPTPAGTFAVVARVIDPAWYQPGKVVPPGPANPLGPRWIGLNRKGYGIHGTNSPSSIGGAKSHGCIRMRNTDVRDGGTPRRTAYGVSIGTAIVTGRFRKVPWISGERTR
jgi:L,D-transpeptidase ErfK/SrfK